MDKTSFYSLLANLFYVDTSTIIFDFDNLKYISSAGLRIIARIKQNYDDLLLDKMSSDVYEIFEMVGFTDMIEIHRK